VPPLDAMNAAPCRPLPDFCFMCRTMPLEVFTVVRQSGEIVAFNMMQRIGECHFALFVMVAVGLAVGCDMNNLRPGSRIRKRGLQTAGQVFSLFEQVLKGDRLGNRAVVKKHRYPPARGQADAVWHGWIDPAAACIAPSATPQLAGAFG